MPRVKRERQKSHTTLPTGPLRPKAAAAAAAVTSDTVSPPAPISALSSSSGASKETDFQLQQLKSKKEKRIERHSNWMDKMNAAQAVQRQQQKQKGRSTNKSVLIRGMGDLNDSLREVKAEIIAQHLLDLDNNSAKAQKTGAQSAAGAVANALNPKSRKARNKAAIKEEKRFGQILVHPAFKADPLATIRQHLANTLPQNKD
ncbi:hypothetical protein LPJ66_001041 [Kickxella alabastrina]|uniref:Uncharacterized protein n=1 Tax=Kickxella alabastrina TaxID=61397 RepID=A0ACC1IUF8_9FUNG|nr:hypothetical protein LPJ66_001041 [Kickxella alabastrina]